MTDLPALRKRSLKMRSRLNIPVELFDGKSSKLIISSEAESYFLEQISFEDAQEQGECRYQIMEGCSYQYSSQEKYYLESIDGIVTPMMEKRSFGRITPSNYTGLLTISVYKDADNLECGKVQLEVCSRKTSYRKDYRLMLEDITEKCTSLVMQQSSPVSQYFTQNYSSNAETLYQQFAFVKSLVDAPEFIEAIHRIVSNPITRWKQNENIVDTRSVRRINNSIIKQYVFGSNRFQLPENHYLRDKGVSSLPENVIVTHKVETVDTPENRFIKHVLSVFRSFSSDIKLKLYSGSREQNEANKLEELLEHFLQEPIFKEISQPQTIDLNSPVLQRKEGYREILRIWLMFDVASKLIWKGGEDVYSAGKRNVAILYEYWLFFKLLDLLQDIFEIKPKSLEKLIEITNDGIGLKLKSGKHIPLSGLYNSGTRKLNIQFSYNRTFGKDSDYPIGGSWTKSMRPDYTLSIWPEEFTVIEAEEQEVIVHIHFDAKYKIEHLFEIIGKDKKDTEQEMDEEKNDNAKGYYKRADLLKMHAYRDAIRRTGGAYVLYPGTEYYKKTGFHEILPGLGAFPIRPSKTDNGIPELKKFILEVIDQFNNRASQQEKSSYQTYDIHQKKDDSKLFEKMPEKYGIKRVLPPDSVGVLIGYCKSEQHLQWISKNKLYNARMDSTRGALRLEPLIAGAEYLLLHKEGSLLSSELWKIEDKGPQVFSKEKIVSLLYPEVPSHDYYLVYTLSKEIPNEFKNVIWNISKLKEYKSGRGSSLAFAVTMRDLMEVKEK